MPAPKGNRFWEARSSHGRKPLWTDPEVLRDACYQYFNWVEDNPLEEAITYQGLIQDCPVPKMRAMSIAGLCTYLGIVKDTWEDYRRKDDFSLVAKEVEQIMFTQKFEGASAGLLKDNIIARDLGLADKKETNHKGNVGITDMSEDRLDEKIRQLEMLHEQSTKD